MIPVLLGLFFAYIAFECYCGRLGFTKTRPLPNEAQILIGVICGVLGAMFFLSALARIIHDPEPIAGFRAVFLFSGT